MEKLLLGLEVLKHGVSMIEAAIAEAQEEAAKDAESEECQHPEELRQSAATSGHPNAWACRCGHISMDGE